MFTFAEPRPVRRPALTPVLDVVFLLVLLFLLLGRYGFTGAVPLDLAATGATADGPPRLIDIAPTSLRLNGLPRDLPGLVGDLDAMDLAPDALIILRPAPGTDVAHLTAVTAALRDAGFTTFAIAEAR